MNGQLVTCNYFGVLDLKPTLGPGFAPNCDSSVVVLTHDLWTRSFGRDPGIIGRSITLNRNAFTVVGVAPEGFGGTDLEQVSFFAPLRATTALLSGPDYNLDANLSWLIVIGRLKDGVKAELARANLNTIASQLDRQVAGLRRRSMSRPPLLSPSPRRDRRFSPLPPSFSPLSAWFCCWRARMLQISY